MGFHKNKRGTTYRQTRAHLERKENGDIYATYKLSFKKDAQRYEYCFIGEKAGILTFDGRVLEKHPAFKNISHFENWCMKYTAEHDMKNTAELDI